MSLLDRYEQQATILRRRHRGNILTDIDVHRHANILMGETQREWKPWMQEIQASGPTMLNGGISGVEVNPPPGDLAAVTITGTEAALWPTATWTPIAANPQAPKAYLLHAFGVTTTPATPGTVLFNARFGQIVTSPLIGVSTTAAQTASQTATPWILNGEITIQRAGPATSGLVVANFKYHQGTATSGGSASLAALEQIFGTTAGATSVVTDGSVAAGLWIGAIAVTSTTNTFKPQSVIWTSVN